MYKNGKRYHAYRTLETLLLTRNVIFIGYGLMDPDFRGILDCFRNDFKESVIEMSANVKLYISRYH